MVVADAWDIRTRLRRASEDSAGGSDRDMSAEALLLHANPDLVAPIQIREIGAWHFEPYSAGRVYSSIKGRFIHPRQALALEWRSFC